MDGNPEKIIDSSIPRLCSKKQYIVLNMRKEKKKKRKKRKNTKKILTCSRICTMNSLGKTYFKLKKCAGQNVDCMYVYYRLSGSE